jgi:hypothetical protein
MAKGRGWLSNIDLLPEEAHPHVRAAYDALAADKRTQDSIRDELNSHLLALGLAPISRGSFHRKALALSKVGSQIAKAREVAAIFAEKLDSMPDGDVGMLINEMVKLIIYQMTERLTVEDIATTAKDVKDISLALYRLEQAGGASVSRRQSVVDQARNTAAEAVRKVAKDKGMSSDMEETILRALGVAGDPTQAPEGSQA